MRLVKNLFLASLVLFVFSCKSTKHSDVNSTKVETTEIQNYDLEHSLLWKIEGNGLEQSSYLFGTIHMINKENFFWPAGTLAALDESEQTAFEVDLDDMFDISAQMGLLTKAFMSDNQKLSDFYSDEEYKIVKAHFKDLGLPMFFLEKIKPMFLTVFASGDLDLEGGLGGDSNVKSYEMELYELCKDSNKDVDGLETLEFQISVFDSIPYQAQADMLLETIKSSDLGDEMFKEMINMYVSQDINKMVTSISDEESGLQGYEDLLLNQRNHNWIPIMAKKMAQAKTFFAVGAGHLGGEEGVIHLLKKEGFTLTPLSQNKG
ncbi:MAG: TraB/GumN family protein [Saprospiraceae bacterium]|nr:TraB/GumN family protein [Bacteroidia bacterium]NNL91368.1 TraB/GumN family protein [Saprospiraceae bacterium]